MGSSLEKVGMHEIDTCELFFDDVRVPSANLLGTAEGAGFSQMMEQLRYERVMIGVGAVATMERAVAITTKYAKERKAFGQTLIEFQNTRFKLAQCKTEAHIGRVFIDNCIEKVYRRQMDAVTAAMAKYWLTECQCRIVDECVQLHGGYGYMTEYPIARMWTDSRVQRIYAGTNEIMLEVDRLVALIHLLLLNGPKLIPPVSCEWTSRPPGLQGLRHALRCSSSWPCGCRRQ